jgi:hypothetical protein
MKSETSKKAAAYYAKACGRSTRSSRSTQLITRYGAFAKLSGYTPAAPTLGWASLNLPDKNVSLMIVSFYVAFHNGVYVKCLLLSGG